jgi:lipoate---protein ligase
MKSLVFIDNEDQTDPAFNLALEEYVLREMDPSRDYLLLYRNDPAVIVGRNQNVLEEVNDSFVRDSKIRILRRLSGGGTVFHDPNNLNFSFITRYEPSRLHNFRFFNAPVVKLLRTLGVPAEMNDRNDILASGRKISGSAQFSSKGRMFSHGTLLFDSELDVLDLVLSVRMKQIESKSHKSVRSVVANISEFLDRPMDVRAFRSFLLDGLATAGLIGSHYGLTDEDHHRILEIRKSRYEKWEWNIGRSPRFRLIRSRTIGDMKVSLDLQVDKGHISQIKLHPESLHPESLHPESLRPETVHPESGNGFDPAMIPDFEAISNALNGVRYDPESVRHRLEFVGARDRLAGGIRVDVDALADLIYGDDSEEG